MDNGEEIPGLNEDWTFAGAKLFEWLAGFMMMLISAEVLVDNPGRSMPLLVGVMVITTTSLASLRRAFPDEERGVRNMVMVACGFPPPGIPKPASIQPLWSGAPLRNLDEKCHFNQLGLGEIFPSPIIDEEEDSIMTGMGADEQYQQ
ncbi:MAG: hypothetical protein J5J00_16620 [Deltaproteobacteria bacterium]|nr:hypothetical protein [Deltaproteobacteria bacterium]